MSQELDHIWSRVQAQLAGVVDEPTYRIWLAPLRAVRLDEHRLVLQAPEHACSWTRERFGALIQAHVSSVLGPDTAVELISGRDAATPAGTRRRAAAHSSATEARAARPSLAPAASSALGNPELTFDQFVIGDCNRLAHAAALAVAEMPAQAYNPLFIFGPPGVGKTHLLSSIANLLLSHDPTLAVRCTTGEAFTNEFLAALAGGHTDSFKLRFRDVDVLLLDDVQFLERKTKTEEEFFHTFNALHDGGRQLVLTSDRPPHDLQALEDRLRERFEAGLVADIKPPELATRLAILRKRVHHDRIAVADERALDAIADHVRSNVRALEGALIRVIAYSSLTGRAVTEDLAREVLDSLYPRSPALAQRRCTVEDVQTSVSRHFGISSSDLLSTARSAHIAWPRQLAMYLARELTGESLPAIGRQFGGRDHTTVLHAWRRASSRIDSDTACREAVDKLRQELDPPRI